MSFLLSVGIDPSGMSETTQALLWVIGLLASGGGCYLLGSKKKVSLDPDTVKTAPTRCEVIRKAYDDHFADNEREHTNAFSRISILEQRVSNMEGQLVHIGASLNRIENKLDDLRSCNHA
jgi:uncharacterized protein YPO0396